MKQIISKSAIREIKVLGSYGKKYHDTNLYPHTLRKLSKDVKASKAEAIAIAAILLAQLLTPNAVLVPVPQSNGKADYTLKLANSIQEIRHDCKVCDVLSGNKRKKLYDIKKSNKTLEGVDLGFKVKYVRKHKKSLSSNPNVYLLDNVLATGFTYLQAKNALSRYADIEPSVLAISALSKWIDKEKTS